MYPSYDPNHFFLIFYNLTNVNNECLTVFFLNENLYLLKCFLFLFDFLKGYFFHFFILIFKVVFPQYVFVGIGIHLSPSFLTLLSPFFFSMLSQ